MPEIVKANMRQLSLSNELARGMGNCAGILKVSPAWLFEEANKQDTSQ